MRLKADPIHCHLTEIKLHKLSKVLEISFDNGKVFKLPCEYLRVFTPSAEALGHAPGQEILQTGKQDIGINEIKAIGNYGISPVFTDGHQTGIYTWELLYKLGSDYETLWGSYLKQLEDAGKSRTA
ncbi:MAG: DUF971 domain-containing protein [Methylococcales bacterium]|nr:DUF971 domain-containing protein [Methylococcales bacterium]